MEKAVPIKDFPQEAIFPKFFCFLTKTMPCYTYRCRNVFTIEDRTTWDRDPAHERTGAGSINARKLLSRSRIHIKTKSKWNICLWSGKLKCTVSFNKCQNVSCWLKIFIWNIQDYQNQVLLYTLTLKTCWYLVTFVSEKIKIIILGFLADPQLLFDHLDYK